jgi:predicted ArsR family transcriptional regulator
VPVPPLEMDVRVLDAALRLPHVSVATHKRIDDVTVLKYNCPTLHVAGSETNGTIP